MKYLELIETVDRLNTQYQDRDTREVLTLLSNEYSDLSLVSSFGTESAVLLHLISKVNPDIPVIFIDTGMLFFQTHDYLETLKNKFRLTNIQTIKPRKALIDEQDADGNLHQTSTNECCFIRKVEPLSRALKNKTIWISGRKRYQSATRSSLPLFELEDMRIKVNPLVNWTRDQISNYIEENNLPQHPLLKYDYLSVGCMPCTTPTKPGEDPRSGRWRGQDKTECGIHDRITTISRTNDSLEVTK